MESKNIKNGHLGNHVKLGVFDGLRVEPIRSEECVQNLADSLGIERGMLVPDGNGKLRIVTTGWIQKK